MENFTLNKDFNIASMGDVIKAGTTLNGTKYSDHISVFFRPNPRTSSVGYTVQVPLSYFSTQTSTQTNTPIVNPLSQKILADSQNSNIDKPSCS